MKLLIATAACFMLLSCNYTDDSRAATSDTIKGVNDSNVEESNKVAQYDYKAQIQKINTGNTTPAELLQFANTLIGTPYKYGSVDPAAGFDCSGFITYVFSHFNIGVPRSSIDFTNVQREVPLADAKPGDLVLFTGTDSTVTHVGHMGIITDNIDSVYHFIHSTSGKSYGVTVTELNGYYMKRFVKVVRVFEKG